jgi:hypothetical protein
MSLWLGHPRSGRHVSSLPVQTTAVPSRTSASGLFVAPYYTLKLFLAGCLKNPLRPKPPRPPAHARDRHFQSAALLSTSVPSEVRGSTDLPPRARDLRHVVATETLMGLTWLQGLARTNHREMAGSSPARSS